MKNMQLRMEELQKGFPQRDRQLLKIGTRLSQASQGVQAGILQ